jgi:hypothetical protein
MQIDASTPKCAKLECISPADIMHMRYSRVSRFALRFAVAALVLFLLLFCGIHAYTVYLTHRAVLLLDEATRIRIGTNEESVLPLVSRYGFVKQAPPRSEPDANCPVTAKGICLDLFPQTHEEIEYRKAQRPDYTYEVDLSPFDVFAALHQRPRGVHLALAYLMFRTPIFLRNLLSLRDWRAFTYIAIRGERVDRVSSGLWVEGSSRWLGHSWHLVGEMFPPSMPQKTYSASEGWLEINTTGDSTDQSITPAANTEQLKAAQSINTGCLTGLIPCGSLHDLSPRAFEYKKLHPESDSNLD